MSHATARILVRGSTRAAAMAAIDHVLSREGYVPFAVARVPPGYPAQKRELTRVGVAGPGEGGTLAVLVEDWDRAFRRALDLSAALRGAMVIALVRPPAEPLRVKAYRGGQLVLKVGDDPDDELFFNPAVADAAAIAAFLSEWGTPAASGIAGAIELERVLDVPCGEPEQLLFINRRSRLYQES